MGDDRPSGVDERERDTQARLLAGDEEAFQAVYERFASLVHGLALRVTRDRTAAEDVTQEVFSHLWARPLAYDPELGTLRTWLAMLAHRRAVDWVRREERRRAVLLPDRSHGDETADEATRTVVAERVRHAVKDLPDNLREPVLLAYFRGHTYRQVASSLGIPEGTAKTRIRSALHRMAAALAAEGMAP